MKKSYGRVYWPSCSVCQFMKANREFKKDIMASSYVNPLGKENLVDVLHKWGDPFKQGTVYMHMKRHQARDLKEKKMGADLLLGPQLASTTVIESPTLSDTPHEQGLDEVIAVGRQMIKDGTMKITASSLLKAITVKADIDMKTKDRRLDALKMMKGAFSGPREGKD